MVSQLSTPPQPPVGAHDHIRGPRSAAISLVEYGDSECPYCRAAVDIVSGLQRALGDQLSFTLRHFPMGEPHSHAQHAAEVAEAAAEQGHFWEMHDQLFANQHGLDDHSLLRYAREMGLDAESLPQVLRDHTYGARIEDDLQSGLASGCATTDR